MKLKTLLLACTIALSPTINAIDFGWVYEKIKKHPYITTAMVVAGMYQINNIRNNTEYNALMRKIEHINNTEESLKINAVNNSTETTNSSPSVIQTASEPVENKPLFKSDTLFYSIAHEHKHEEELITTTEIAQRVQKKPLRSCMKGSRAKALELQEANKKVTNS